MQNNSSIRYYRCTWFNVNLFILAYLGSSNALGVSENGGLILTNVVNELYGTSGKILLDLLLVLACLTTSVGLTSACAGFFTNLFPKLSHKTIVNNGMCI